MGLILLSSTWYGADTAEQHMVWGGYYGAAHGMGRILLSSTWYGAETTE